LGGRLLSGTCWRCNNSRQGFWKPSTTICKTKGGLSLRQGTIVDATIIHAPSSTKNKDGKRDPEMHQTKMYGQPTSRKPA